MRNDDILDLLGRYATGSLTETERQRLFDAALSDQDLFEDLAREQELKMLLDEPGARDRMIRALRPPTRRSTWILGGAAAAALSVVAIAVLIHPRPKPPQVAMVTPVPAPAAVAPAEAAPAPSPPKTKPAAKKSEARAAQPVVVDEPSKDAAAKKEVVEVQTEQLKVQPGEVQLQQNTVGGPRQMAPQSRAARIVDLKTPTFGFHYSIETKGHLIIIPGADGYLFVTANDGKVLFPRKRIAAGITTDVPIPGAASSIIVGFSATDVPAPSPVERTGPEGMIQGAPNLAIRLKINP